MSLPLSIAGEARLARAAVRLRCEEDNSGVPTSQLEVSLVSVDLLCIVSSHVGGVAAQLAEVFACVDWGPLVAVSDRSGSLGGAHGDDRQLG